MGKQQRSSAEATADGLDASVHLADVMAEAARILLEEDDADQVLHRMSKLAVDTIEPAQHCGITIVAGGKVSTPASTDDVPVLVDQIQYDTGQGPCLDAIRHHETFTSPDITRETQRWPDFAARAARETPVRSVMSFRLFTSERTYGALNMYSQRVDAFGPTDDRAGSAFAAHAAVALSGTSLVDSLRRALDTRDTIATAKGMIMVTSQVDADAAFEMLKQASMRENVKLSAVAQRIVDGHSGQLHGGT